MDGHWKFRGGGEEGVGEGGHRPKFLKESMKLNWNFQRGEGIQNQKTIHRGGMVILQRILIEACMAGQGTSCNSLLHRSISNKWFHTFVKQSHQELVSFSPNCTRHPLDPLLVSSPG